MKKEACGVFLVLGSIWLSLALASFYKAPLSLLYLSRDDLFLVLELFLAWLVCFLAISLFAITQEKLKDWIHWLAASTLTFFLIGMVEKMPFVLAALVTILFPLLLWQSAEAMRQRLEVFIKPAIWEMVVKAGKNSLFLISFLAVIISTFSLSWRIKNGESLFKESEIVKTGKPIANLLNKILPAVLDFKFGDQLKQSTGIENKGEMTRFILSEIVETSKEGQTRQELGFNPDNLNLEQIEVRDNGEINLWPAISNIIPEITQWTNSALERYSHWAALIIALIQWLVFQPFVWLESFLMAAIIAGIIWILIKTGFIKQKKEQKEITRFSW